jgi:hypothetical protein
MRSGWLAIGAVLLMAGMSVRSAEPSAAPSAQVPAATGELILDENSPWRFDAAWRTPVLRKSDGSVQEFLGEYAWGMQSYAAQSTPPPADWRASAFDDGEWSRWRGPASTGLREEAWKYGFASAGNAGPTLAGLYLRGRFRVDDPAAVTDLTLSLTYRGGAAVFVNGQELVRSRLPAGDLTAETLAEDYPQTAFVQSNGIPYRTEGSEHTRFKAEHDQRLRQLVNIPIPARLLRPGVNVLAVEIHRAPYFGSGLEREGMNFRCVWSTCGLVDVSVRAAGGVAPNLGRPRGVQVWSAPFAERITNRGYADPLALPAAVTITGCRNGLFTGVAVVSSDAPFSRLTASVGDLRQQGGAGTIPAAAIQVLYARPTWFGHGWAQKMLMDAPDQRSWFDLLSKKPPAEAPVPGGEGRDAGRLGAVQPVWIKVRVPAETPAGQYEGRLKVQVAGRAPVEMPVRLDIADWTLPDPKDFVTHTGLIQSPESVAFYYQKPLWSDEHWALLEKNLRFLGELGNKNVYLPMICETNFGNDETCVYWVKQADGSFQYDFRVFDRYLDLVQKYTPPDVVVLYIWDLYTDFKGGWASWHRAKAEDNRGLPVKVSLLDPATGQVTKMEGPRWSEREASLAFWRPVLAEVYARLARRGLGGATVRFGLSPDRGPLPETGKLLADLAPAGGGWADNSHGGQEGSMAGLPISYATRYYINSRPPPPWNGQRRFFWQRRTPMDRYMRGWRVGLDAADVYSMTEWSQLQNLGGLGRSALDLWPISFVPQAESQKRDKQSPSLGGRFPLSHWDQLNVDRATEYFIVPGPDGPMSTQRFEALRESIQECEARIVLEKAVADPSLSAKLGDDLVRRCRAVIDERLWNAWNHCPNRNGAGPNVIGTWWYSASGTVGPRRRVFATAAEVARALASGR